MTLRELQDKIYRVGVCCSGQFEVVILYRNKLYRCKSNNTLAYDAIKSDERIGGYTPRQAMQSLYDECKRKNNLK